MNIIAPRPKKASSYSLWTEQEEDNDACQELRQILSSYSHKMEDLTIIRTNNPLPNDTSFVPIHQAVSHLSVSENSQKHRPRSFSVGDSRNYPFNSAISLVH
jgi:C4-type Zn-finger protein